MKYVSAGCTQKSGGAPFSAHRSLPRLLCAPPHALQGHHPVAQEAHSWQQEGLDVHLKEAKIRMAKKFRSPLLTAKTSP